MFSWFVKWLNQFKSDVFPATSTAPVYFRFSPASLANKAALLRSNRHFLLRQPGWQAHWRGLPPRRRPSETSAD